MVADVSEFSSSMDGAVAKYAKIGASMQAVGDRMTTHITLPLIAAGTAAVKFASDLAETRNKTAVIFGDMTDQVMEMGKGADLAMGMSERAALDYASTYGSILKNMNLGQEAVTEMSIALTGLTSDYASFHNLKPEEAFEKIKAGLVGSSEPLISLGKDLRITAVEAYAAANGIGTVGKELTTSEMALARYGSLLAQSTDELGDFGRTADGLANSTRTVKALFENTLASFGESLLPVATELMRALIPILDWFNSLPAPVKTGIVYMLMFVAALGPLLSGVGRILQGGKAIQGVLGAKGVTGLFAKLGPMITGAGGGLASFGSAIVAAAGPALALGAAIALLILTIKYLGPQAWQTVQMIVAIIGEFVKRGVAKIKEFEVWVGTLIIRTAIKIAMGAKNFYNAGAQLMAGFINGIKAYAAQLIQAVLQPVAYVIAQVRRMLGLHSPSKVFEGIGMNMMLGLAQGIDKYAPKSIDASVTAVSTVMPGKVAGIGSGSGSGRSLEIKEINIYGMLSESEKKGLRAEIREIFQSEFNAVLS